ncbi:pre translocase secY subunit [Micractinium conductrix]|uniref:CpSecY n=1 Tax=Micractinium conductrix TaxID=554055 RepID=A0A2P6V6S1_9CHLO|nr:pre translocase secY subunit [Micractinium conductrix]|eukprot:PSC69780.1 pre translocase secY subunit [Micractinium conductrix]
MLLGTQRALGAPAGGLPTQRRRPGAGVRVQAASLGIAPGRWLGPQPAPLGGGGGDAGQQQAAQQQQAADERPVYGLELTADQWDPLNLTVLKAETRGQGLRSTSGDEQGGTMGDFLGGDLPKKLALLIGLIMFSRLGVYLRLPGVDVERFSEAMQGSGGIMGYIDTLSGGSISKVGVFSLGIVPYINASILFQLLATAFPSLKKLQREEGPQGRARFQQYQKAAALIFAVAQAIGQLTYLRPFVEDFSPAWLAENTVLLTCGAMILVYVADTISELKIGNGTSILIFANIASSLPTSVGAALTQAADKDSSVLGIYSLAWFLTTLGIVYVQDAERQIPIQYASRYSAGALQRQAYLPFKVNATGVMPVIFASSLLALPASLARYANAPALESAATALSPAGALYLPANVALIVAFNYLYTFLQLDPKDLSEQLKRQGASIPGVRPGRATAEYITKTLDRMSVLGSIFLGALAAAPALVESITGLQAFRGFAGTSVLILVGVATDTARRFRSELAMSKYKDIDKMYDDLRP